MRRISLFFLVAAWFAACITSNAFADTRAEAKSWYRKGNVYLREGKYEEAQQAFACAAGLLGESPEESVVPSLGQGVNPGIPGPGEYVISLDDVLSISVWQNPDLNNQEINVRPDGQVSFPLIGDVQAAGLTIPQLASTVTNKLKEFIRDPQVSIAIRKIGGSKVIVLGEVSQPGIYSVTGAKTVLEAISLARGYTRDAIMNSVILIRGGFVNPQAQRLNLVKAMKGTDLTENVSLQSEDIIFVPRSFISDLNYVLNQVMQPLSQGAYSYSAYGVLMPKSIRGRTTTGGSSE